MIKSDKFIFEVLIEINRISLLYIKKHISKNKIIFLSHRYI